MNPSSFTGGISVNVYEIYQEMRGGQPTGVARNFANTVAKTSKDMPVLSDRTNCFKYDHTEVEYGVKKRKHCTETEHGRHVVWKTSSPIRTVPALIMMILAMIQTITITRK